MAYLFYLLRLYNRHTRVVLIGFWISWYNNDVPSPHVNLLRFGKSQSMSLQGPWQTKHWGTTGPF